MIQKGLNNKFLNWVCEKRGIEFEMRVFEVCACGEDLRMVICRGLGFWGGEIVTVNEERRV